MIRVMDIKGIPVISLQDGRRLGYVDGPVFDNNDCLTGFLLESRGLMPSRKYIALDNMLRVDRNSCVVYNSNSVEKLPVGTKSRRHSGHEDMLGKDVKNASGNSLGVVKDLVYSTETGSIQGLELSRGFIDDALEGRNVVMVKDGIEVAEEYITVGRDRNE